MWQHSFRKALLLLTMLCASQVAAQTTLPIQKIENAEQGLAAEVVIDTRPLSSCQKSSLPHAVCVPVEDVLAPRGRLANWSSILWLLGSAGLTGHEHVLVVGELEQRRDFLAGLLMLAGQKQVGVLQQALSDVLASNEETYSGRQRATTRTNVYTVPMRSELIVLRNELSKLVAGNITIVDGRSEAQYYGADIRASRGGHIPGANHSPIAQWRSDPVRMQATYHSMQPVAYAHDPFETLVYFTTLAAAGITPRVYLAGWVEWAFDSTLAVDSASYAQNNLTANTRPAINSNAMQSSPFNTQQIATAIAFIVCLLLAGFYGGRKFARRSA